MNPLEPIDEVATGNTATATATAGWRVDREVEVEVVVVGGGQAGLAAGYFLRRAGLEFVVLDAQSRPGGTWRHGWGSLRLFSPAGYSPLPGWWMPNQPGEPFPTTAHVRDYLSAYEARYALPVHRPVDVTGVRPDHAGTDQVDGAYGSDGAGGANRAGGRRLVVESRQGCWRARAVISATGSWRCPHWPSYPGGDLFRGRQLHTVSYHRPEAFTGERVVVVGGGNSAAQILAEVSTVADTTWVASRPPRLLPDDVDGRVLFDLAVPDRARASDGSDGDDDGDGDPGGVAALGDIVMVPSVRAARDRGVLHAEPMFTRLTPHGVAWSDGTEQQCDTIIWCTGFRPDLEHLAPLELTTTPAGVPRTEGTRSLDDPRLHLLGYGDWTGAASATLIGAGRTAKNAVADIAALLATENAGTLGGIASAPSSP